MNLLDLVILVFAAVALTNGLRRGFSLAAPSYVGLVAGTALGAFLAPTIERSLRVGTGTAPYVGLAVLVVAASIGSSVGYGFGEPVRSRLRRLRGLFTLDSMAGAVFSVFTVLATSWFLGLAFVRGPVPQVSGAIRESVILRRLDTVFPRPPSFLAGVEQIIAGVPYPRVFAGIAPPSLPEPVTVDPAIGNNPAVAAAARQTVKVRSLGCGGEVFGSGFPAAADYVVSNAHVVAGTHDNRVLLPDGRLLPAQVVLFDPERDVSILHVSGLRLTPLGTAAGSRGTPGATIGYPGGGGETIGAAAIRTTVQAVGRDIYGEREVSRQVYVLQADIRPGNSGGPFVDAQGRVLGVVFANSTTTPSEGYALTDTEVAPDIAAGTRRTAAVDVGPCAS